LSISVVTWDIDTKDWQTHDIKSEERAYESMKDDKATTLGHIALEHEVYAQTVQDFVPWAVNYVESLGYTFVTVADCLGVNAYQ
jgi:peptidoglycan/xylan/chitin deacetylase (PgdA/CDA1 family)